LFSKLPILIYKLPHPIKKNVRLFLPHTGIPQGLNFLQQAQNIDYKKWENQMVNTFVNVIYVKMK
jgi:hypothetical protein